MRLKGVLNRITMGNIIVPELGGVAAEQFAEADGPLAFHPGAQQLHPFLHPLERTRKYDFGIRRQMRRKGHDE